MEGTLGAIEIV
ncbi:hypothetical protein A2U01_0063483, partial [Trifolium medium]|nr:hypothetical protein [Trifolium medium]